MGIFFTPLQQPVRKWEWHHWPNTVKRKEKPNWVNLMILIFRVNESLPYTQAPHTQDPILCWNFRENYFRIVPKGNRQCMQPMAYTLQKILCISQALLCILSCGHKPPIQAQLMSLGTAKAHILYLDISSWAAEITTERVSTRPGICSSFLCWALESHYKLWRKR